MTTTRCNLDARHYRMRALGTLRNRRAGIEAGDGPLTAAYLLREAVEDLAKARAKRLEEVACRGCAA
jgi:hypothetical protein